MFAVVRTGGKQYRVTPGDKIVVEKLPGEAGQRVDLTDVLLAGDGSDLKSTQGLTVAAEIVAQAKGEKVTVFKKRRRHNYRRKKGHRQQHTILKIVAIGGEKAPAKAAKAEGSKKSGEAPKAAASAPAPAAPAAEAPAPEAPAKETKPKAARPKKAASSEGEAPSTKNAAPAKGAAKKSAKGSKAE